MTAGAATGIASTFSLQLSQSRGKTILFRNLAVRTKIHTHVGKVTFFLIFGAVPKSDQLPCLTLNNSSALTSYAEACHIVIVCRAALQGRVIFQRIDRPPILLIQFVMTDQPAFTYIGGPTALLEWGGVRFLTGPTFDPAGSQSTTGPVTLKKLADPAIRPDSLGKIDVVLLSHDHHYDNLDRAGRTLLPTAGRVLTTRAGAERLTGNAVGLETWESLQVSSPVGGNFTITATPARHGPAGLDRGPVCGFVVSYSEASGSEVYISGDTVWYDQIAEIAKRFNVSTALLFMGAAQVPAVPNSPLTMTAADAVEAAHAFSRATIIPLHYEGWAHFTESREQIAASFDRAGLQQRVLWLPPRKKVTV